MEVPSGINGVVMHTMVADLPSVINSFNDPNFQASAHFGIAQSGHIHQFGPVNGWMAWAQKDGNTNWYSIEHADHSDPNNRLTDAQLTASAQIVEALSAYGKFPLQEANNPAEEGYGVHSMGGRGWGGHPCPDISHDHHVRSLQRPEILHRAKLIRAGGLPPPPVDWKWTSDGSDSLADLGQSHGVAVSTLLRLTADHEGGYDPHLAGYINDQVNWHVAVPPGASVWTCPHHDHTAAPVQWTSDGEYSMATIASSHGMLVSDVLAMTVQHNSGGAFDPAMAGYLNNQIGFSAKIPAGATVWVPAGH